MKIINLKTVPKQHLGLPIFLGKVTRQSPVTDDAGSDVTIDYVHFEKGSRNKFHIHSNDQVLIVTQGKGIVATKQNAAHVKKGDVVWVPAGEVHWHGAEPDASFTHVSVTRARTKLTIKEE